MTDDAYNAIVTFARDRHLPFGFGNVPVVVVDTDAPPEIVTHPQAEIRLSDADFRDLRRRLDESPP